MQGGRCMGLEDHTNTFGDFSDLGCSLWLWSMASHTSDLQLKQIEKTQKRLITNKFEIKSVVPYEIMLSEVGATSIEAIAMVWLIRYLKISEQMEDGRWPLQWHIVQKKEYLDAAKYKMA